MASNLPEQETRDGELIRRGPYPEFTIPGILVGWFLGAIIALSIAYASLKLGFSIEGSELAAILGWGILRGLLRRTSIAENNINQTIASAVNGASSGIMFCVPALFILSKTNGLESVDDGFDGFFSPTVFLMIFACITGAFMGLAFVIPLRKQMIDFDRLPYPGGIAVATILKSPGAGIRKALYLLGGAGVSAVVYLCLFMVNGDEHDWLLGQQLSLPAFLNITFFLSLMTIGVGFLSGKGGFWFGAGGFICYWLLAPFLALFGSTDVKEVMDPPVRTSVVQVADVETIDRALLLYGRGDEDPVVKNVRTGYPVSSDDENREAPSYGNFLDSELAALNLDKLCSLLEGQAEQLEADQKLTVTEDGEEVSYTKDELQAIVKEIREGSSFVDLVSFRAINKQLSELDASKAKPIREAKTQKELRAAMTAAGLSLESEEEEGTASPVLVAAGTDSNPYSAVPGGLRSQLFRPAGIGMLIGAAIGGILIAFPLIRSAFGSLMKARQTKGSAADAGRDEMPIIALVIAVLLGLVVLIGLAFMSVKGMTLTLAVTMAVLGTVWVWIAGVIVAECIGRTNWSPLSGMTLIAVTILILIAQTGLNDPQTVLSCIVVGAAICLAISQASDMMLDLKSGYLIGAVPRRQQIAQFVGAWLGPIVVLTLLIVLSRSYEFGSKELPAPQGTALATTIQGLIDQNIPIYRYVAGGILGFGLAASGLGGIGVMVALGFYMPFSIVLTYTIGCTLRMLTDKYAGKPFSENVGIPIAAGLIVGEALVGVGIAIVKIFG